MSAPRIREAIDKLAGVFAANPEKARVKNAPAAKLKELVEWSEAHSPVGCTVRNAPSSALDIEIA